MNNALFITWILFIAMITGLSLGYFGGKVEIYETLYGERITCKLETFAPPVEIE